MKSFLAPKSANADLGSAAEKDRAEKLKTLIAKIEEQLAAMA